MSPRLPDPRRSRAVLVGTSAYDSQDLKPLLAVRNNLEVLHELLTSDDGGFLPGRCAVVQDSSDPRGVCRQIREAAHDAPDTLLVYFSGHGILNHDYTELHLALTGTDQSDLRWTSVPFQAIREIFETAACRNKILILDCCQSGWVMDAMMSASDGTPVPLGIRGTHLLTSSSADLKSYAPPEDRYTAFTGELIQLLRDGVPGGPELLTLSALFEPLATALEHRRMPRPQQQASNDHASLALVRNAAEGRSARISMVKEVKELVPETRLTYDTWYRRTRWWGAGLPAMGGAAWVYVRFGPRGDEQLDPSKTNGAIAIAACVAAILVLMWLSRTRPENYSLVIASEGIEVRYGREHFYYPWHRVGRVWVAASPGSRLRGNQYTLMLRPKPGVLIKTGNRGTPGPRRDPETGALRFADLRHLDTPPVVVEKALARNAGSAWTPSGGQLALPEPDQDPVEVFGTDRRLFAAVAAAAAAVAYLSFPTVLFTRPSTFGYRIGPLLICAAACAVLWFCGSRVLRPVRLEISAAGVSLTRFDLEIAYAWSEIERIGVVDWPPGVNSLGLLALSPTPRAGLEPLDRTAFYLPKLALGCLTLCSLTEVTREPQRLDEALRRYGGKGQVTEAEHAWLRSTPARAARARRAASMRDGTKFTGLRTQGTAVALEAALFAPTLSVSMASNDLGPLPDLLVTVDALLLSQLPVFGLLAYFLTGHHRMTLHIGTSGLTLVVHALRIHTLRVPWGDIESIGIMVRQHPSVRHSLVMWLRPGARPPRSLWWRFPQEYGGLRVVAIEVSRLATTPLELDRAVARHAGHRHSRMTRLPRRPTDKTPAPD
ncbi:caspase family protein [Streptomyces sp. NPDC047072]|uniref:caspase family protein n=1 Tax=Streptomyces sp. NPDC047072 TaxID=3154809 RepID=UPI0033FC455A